MDRNTITGLVLIFLVFIGFSLYNNSQLNKGFEKAIEIADSYYAKGEFENARTEYINALRYKPNHPDAIAKVRELNVKLGLEDEAKVVETTANDSVNSRDVAKSLSPALSVAEREAVKQTDQYGAFASAAVGENEFITLENNILEVKISLKGGKVISARLKEYRTHDSLPLFLFSGDSTIFGFNFFTYDNKPIKTNDLFFEPVDDRTSFNAINASESVVLRLMSGENSYIEYKYTLAPDKYMIDFDVIFKSMEGIIAANQNKIGVDWKMYIPQKEKGRQNEENYSTIKYKYFQETDVGTLKMMSKKETESANLTARLNWVAFQGQFFSSVLINNNFFLSGGSIESNRTISSEKYIKHYSSELEIPYNHGIDNAVSLKFYFGPNSIPILKEEGMELEKIVFLGRSIIGWISRFVIVPTFNWLNGSISNYGIIILILTIIIKVVLFPLTFKSYQSTAKMQVLKPLVDELGKKYPKQEDAMKKQQATMDLYKRAGVNPMGGCLPMLLQFPILFAMFRFFPVSIELRQQSFLWATDLSTYDSILTLPFTIPMYGNHVSLFTLLMSASNILIMKMSGTQPGSDQPGMKMMMYVMPVMMLLILNNFSAALTYYYFLANILTYLQNKVSKQFINSEAVLATLEANKKKPVKKSNWQQRIEAAARQRGINPPKR